MKAILYPIQKPIGRCAEHFFVKQKCDSVHVCVCMCGGTFFLWERKQRKCGNKQAKIEPQQKSKLSLFHPWAERSHAKIDCRRIFSRKAIDSQTIKIGEQRGTIATWLSGDKMETRAGTLISLTYFLSLSPGSVGTLIGALSVQPRPNPVFALSLRGISVPKSKELVPDQTEKKTYMWGWTDMQPSSRVICGFIRSYVCTYTTKHTLRNTWNCSATSFKSE